MSRLHDLGAGCWGGAPRRGSAIIAVRDLQLGLRVEFIGIIGLNNINIINSAAIVALFCIPPSIIGLRDKRDSTLLPDKYGKTDSIRNR